MTVIFNPALALFAYTLPKSTTYHEFGFKIGSSFRHKSMESLLLSSVDRENSANASSHIDQQNK